MAKNAKRHKIKQNGVRTDDWCTICQRLGCDPFGYIPGTPAEIKREKRYKLGQCIGCGKQKEKCACRSSEHKKR